MNFEEKASPYRKILDGTEWDDMTFSN